MPKIIIHGTGGGSSLTVDTGSQPAQVTAGSGVQILEGSTYVTLTPGQYSFTTDVTLEIYN